MEGSSDEMGVSEPGKLINSGLMRGVTEHSCCKEADFSSPQRGLESGHLFRQTAINS